MSSSSTITKVPDTGHDYSSFASPLPHPGELLREDYLPDYGLTPLALAIGMGFPDALSVEAVLAEQAPIDAAFALRLGKVFGQDPNLWMRMQASHDVSKTAIAEREELRRITRIAAAA